MLPILSGVIVPLTPRIIRMLKMLLPMAFPTAIPALFLKAATTLVANSGKLVPIATIVKPTRLSLIPIRNAMLDALSTKRLPP